MNSLFTWLDTSEHDRRRALDVVDLFALRDTRDELGFGAIRDAWSDRLAPGTSTIQRRARYFLFVPWMYLELERLRSSPDTVARKARREETRLIEAIEETDPNAVPIGALVGKGLKRLPSSIYWAGLGTLRIRLFEGSQEQYHRSFGRWKSSAGDWLEIEDDNEGRPKSKRSSGAWHPHVPPPPDDFPKRAELELRHVEAVFLREQVRQYAAGSLLHFLMDDDASGDLAVAESLGLPEDAPRDFSWDHPRLAAMPPELQRSVRHARNFSVLVHGAALLYNLMLAELVRSDEYAERHGAAFEDWVLDVEALRPELAAWNEDEFWSVTRASNPRLPIPSQRFARDWIALVRGAGDGSAVRDDKRARGLVSQRERELKRGRARLHSTEHREQWSGSSGANRIDFRWGITKQLVRDVHVGLRRD